MISREQIEQKLIAEPLNILKSLTVNPSVAKYFRERVEISFDGFKHVTTPIWNIEIVRDYVRQLDNEFPYWFYFLCKNGIGLAPIVRCFLLPFLTPEGDRTVNTERLKVYLENRGFPAMDEMCQFTNETEEEWNELTERAMQYFFKTDSSQ
ncbi:MAG: hypothetical protein ABIQ74_13755 [Chitinophagales bacterium]